MHRYWQVFKRRRHVPGCGKLSTLRARGCGSNPFVNNVSDPDASNTNGSRLATIAAVCLNPSGRPAAYIADCHCTPDNGVPTGFASITPTACLSTNNK
jgi:hypothetical protein